MNIAEANGIKLAWESFGDIDGEAVLLISGLGTQMVRWTSPFCEGLAALGYRVIRFDNRDAGCSTHLSACPLPNFDALASALSAGRRPEVPYTLYDMAADAIGLLDALSIGRVHVVGRSMGGMIAQIMASETRSRVLSLTSIMSSTGNPALPPAEPDAMAMMMEPMPDPALDLEGFLSRSSAFARRIAGKGYPFDKEAHRALVLEEIRRGHEPAGTARQIAAIAVAGDRRAQLSTVTAPTLVIHGNDDPLFLPACGRDTAGTIPGAELLLIDGMGHDLPARVWQQIAGKIDSVARRAAPA
ncbi:alpha/beta fold hydrolase [Hephaestia mangrovi]|uniref:alpha/beta fold hydrolase n=1 Tax=Hephaestia mangrovi TaxID=2873268 RepID=UPI001CA6FAC9|nr:alpha/beta hydrolase [Hephaestia mangrovi]MBY8828862.1 alpha/beta fold hydrolase [Hephaestia mangrovi]